MSAGNLGLEEFNPDNVLGAGPKMAVADGTFTEGNLVAFDTTGTHTDSGIAASSVSGSMGTATPILDRATGQPIVDADGHWIYPR